AASRQPPTSPTLSSRRWGVTWASCAPDPGHVVIVEQRNQAVSLLGVLHMNQSEPIQRLPSGRYCEPRSKLLSSSTLKPVLIAGLCIAFFLQCLSLAQVDLGALVEGMPRLARWAAKAWPPYLDDLDRMLFRAAETVAIATVATVAATLVAFP